MPDTPEDFLQDLERTAANFSNSRDESPEHRLGKLEHAAGNSATTPEAFLEDLQHSSATHPNDELVPPGKRPCPICGEAMVPAEQWGLTLDVCPSHGVWLDRGEIQAIIASAAMNETTIRRQVLDQLRREGKLRA